jgi:hypothetical protein
MARLPFRLLPFLIGLLGACGLQEHSHQVVTTTAPLPPAGVEIDGAFVPRDRAVVFIHFGHSNMVGRGTTPVELQPFFFSPAPHLWSYQGGGTFIPAVEPTAPDSTLSPGGGPGLPWLRIVAASAAADYHFISLAWARSGSASPEFVKGGVYYSSFMDRALELKGRVTFGALFIMLGITELQDADEKAFAGRIAAIVADIRRDLDEPGLPVLHTDYEMNAGDRWAITTPLGHALRAQVQWLPSVVPDLVLIPTDGTPMLDNHHFDLTGQKMWVERGIQLMKDRGWFRWGP